MQVGKRMQIQILEISLLAVGAIVGAVLRWQTVNSPLMIGPLQVNVLLVNIVGSFVLGAFSAASLCLNLDAKYSLLVAVGFCGSLTTMSSFALETANLYDASKYGLMLLNVLANVGLSFGAVIMGKYLIDLVLSH
jgi:fluoride exporter